MIAVVLYLNKPDRQLNRLKHARYRYQENSPNTPLVFQRLSSPDIIRRSAPFAVAPCSTVAIHHDTAQFLTSVTEVSNVRLTNVQWKLKCFSFISVCVKARKACKNEVPLFNFYCHWIIPEGAINSCIWIWIDPVFTLFTETDWRMKETAPVFQNIWSLPPNVWEQLLRGLFLSSAVSKTADDTDCSYHHWGALKLKVQTLGGANKILHEFIFLVLPSCEFFFHSPIFCREEEGELSFWVWWQPVMSKLQLRHSQLQEFFPTPAGAPSHFSKCEMARTLKIQETNEKLLRRRETDSVEKNRE